MSRIGPPNPPLMYNDTFAILQGYEMKMRREGYFHWFVQVFRTEGFVWIADALVTDNEDKKTALMTKRR